MIAETNWAQPELECLVEFKDGKTTALTNSYDPSENSMSFEDRLFVAMRENSVSVEEMN